MADADARADRAVRLLLPVARLHVAFDTGIAFSATARTVAADHRHTPQRLHRIGITDRYSLAWRQPFSDRCAAS